MINELILMRLHIFFCKKQGITKYRYYIKDQHVNFRTEKCKTITNNLV